MLLFYNGDNASNAESNDWFGFKNPDETKLAWVCAKAWAMHEWEVERFTCEIPNCYWGPGTPLAKSAYPYNGFLIALRQWMTKNCELKVAWTTTDVIPNRCVQVEPAWVRLSLVDNDLWLPTAPGTFTLCAGAATLKGINALIDALRFLNDWPTVEPLGLPFVCDEYLLRTAEQAWRKWFPLKTCYADVVTVPQNNTCVTNTVHHYSRSVLNAFPKPGERFE